MNATEQYIHDRDEQVRKNMAEINEPKWGYDDMQTNSDRIADFTSYLLETKYAKNFTWMGRPILQFPNDLMVMQELIWQIKPDYIIETGVAFGGMTVFYASILEAIGHGMVFGIDNEIREHNGKEINRHRLGMRIQLVEKDSVAPDLLTMIKRYIGNRTVTVLVSLDSNHTHDHVLHELRLYAPLVSVGSYIVVFDTIIEFFPELTSKDRPWGKGNNPWMAVQEFMKGNDEFVVDKEIETRAILTCAPGGWLKRVKEAECRQ